MSLRDRIKQKTDQVIAKFAKPKPTPQPTHGTVTGFSQGLIKVSTSDGQQLRQQQGTRAIGEGDRVIAHDNTAVFTGEAGVLPKQGRVFIAAQPKKKFEDYYLYLYREYTPESVAIADAYRSQRPGYDYPVESQSEPAVRLEVFIDGSSATTIQREKLIISNGRGLVAEVPGWEIYGTGYSVSWPSLTGIALDNLHFPNPRVIVYQGNVTVIWGTAQITGNPSAPYGTPMSSTTTGQTRIASFNTKLQFLNEKTKVNRVINRRSEPPFHSSRTTTTTYSLVPELDHAVYAKGANWLPPERFTGYLTHPQNYGSQGNFRVFPLGFSRFNYYTIEGPFPPLTLASLNAQASPFDHTRPNASSLVGAVLIDDSGAYSVPPDQDAELERLAALVDAPDYSDNPGKAPYFQNVGVWKNDIANYGSPPQ